MYYENVTMVRGFIIYYHLERLPSWRKYLKRIWNSFRYPSSLLFSIWSFSISVVAFLKFCFSCFVKKLKRNVLIIHLMYQKCPICTDLLILFSTTSDHSCIRVQFFLRKKYAFSLADQCSDVNEFYRGKMIGTKLYIRDETIFHKDARRGSRNATCTFGIASRREQNLHIRVHT